MILFLVRQYKDRDGPRTREEILNIIRLSPGLTKTEIKQSVGLAWGTIYYHLRVLQSEKQLVAKRYLGRTRIYTSDATEEIRLMPLMRLSLATDLVERVRQSPGIGIQALSAQLGISRKTIRRHLFQLVDSGMLQKSSHYRPRFYTKQRGPISNAEARLTPEARP
jgi:predicted transcriptional regulator